VAIFIACFSFPLAQTSVQQPGSFDFFFSSRSFRNPLFGTRSVGSYRFSAFQTIPEMGVIRGWYSSGFPSYTPYFGVNWSGLPFRNGMADLTAGDFALRSLQPQGPQFLTDFDIYPLRGFQFTQEEPNGDQWQIFTGRATRFRDIPRRNSQAPILLGGNYLTGHGFNHFGASVTLVSNPIRSTETGQEGIAAVFSGKFIRDLSPWSDVFGEILSTERGGMGAKAGFTHRNQRYQFRTTVYAFDSTFAFLDPIYRPGEKGIQAWVRYYFSESVSASGYLDYVGDSEVDLRTDWRGGVALNWSFGAGRPYLLANYSRNVTVFDYDSVAEPGTTVDRISLSGIKASSSAYYSLQAEHLMNSSDGFPDRTQFILDFRKETGNGKTYWDGSIVSQLLGDSNLGITSEVALEKPFWRNLYYRIGTGAGFRRIDDQTLGEGIILGGISKHFLDSGWSARVEMIQPFSIGLERSNLAQTGISVNFGYRLGWRDLGNFRKSIQGLPGFGGETGTIRGRVLGENLIDVEGIPILLNGRFAATTASDGSFQIKRVDAGPGNVSIDLKGIDSRYGVVDGQSRQVSVAPNTTVFVDFSLRPFSYFQGVIILCFGDEILPLKGIKLTLRNEQHEISGRTDNLGSFQFGDIPPGVYKLVISEEDFKWPENVQMPLSWKVDLSSDKAGHVIRIACPEDFPVDLYR
jgi:hypothetical protein